MGHLPILGLVIAPPQRRRWRNWVDAEPVLAGLGRWRLLDVLNGCDDADGRDPVLVALARLARGGDPEAAMLLLAALAPGARRLASRYARTLGYDEAVAIAVAAVWDRIARFGPPPSHVAYRFMWLAGRRLHRAAVDQRARSAETAALDAARDLADRGGADHGLPAGLLLGEAVDAGVVADADAWLLEATELDGVDLRAAAHRLGVSYEAAKKRRQRATAALGDWWEDGPPATKTTVRPALAASSGRAGWRHESQ